ERYQAVLLCCLEGRTVAEAARALGVPRGTAAAWLARARRRLRGRLDRRWLTRGALFGSPLFQGGMKVMFASPWKVAAALVLVLAPAVGRPRPPAARPPPPAGKVARGEQRPGLARLLSLSRAVERALAWHGPRAARAEVRRQVEQAYWELYAAYCVLH